MPYEELQKWSDYYALEPFGEIRADLRAGAICATFANANRDPKKRAESYVPSDFMPYLKQQADEEPKDIVAPETKAFFYSMARQKRA